MIFQKYKNYKLKSINGDLVLDSGLSIKGSRVQIIPKTSDLSEQKICSSSPRYINGYPDRTVFVQVCYSLSVRLVPLNRFKPSSKIFY